MITHYFKLAIRLLTRSPFFSIINVLGLSAGFAVFIILWQYSRSELKSDQFYKDADRIVRGGVIWKWTDDGANWEQQKYGGIMANVTPTVRSDFGDFEDALEIYNQGNFESPLFGHGNSLVVTCTGSTGEKTRFVEERISYATPNLFRFFDIPLVQGQPSNVLDGLRATVLSQSVARKYFGGSDPVGSVLFLNDSLPLIVTGVFKDLPANTHLNFQIVISTDGLGLEKITGYQLAHAYFKLNPGVRIEQLQSKLEHYSRIYFQSIEEELKGNIRAALFLQPLSEVPYSLFELDTFTVKSKNFLIILGVLSLVVLSMAWVNYINLTLAASRKRMKELGARKAAGATTKDFARQFLLESAVINTISLAAALTLVQLLRVPASLYFRFHIPAWADTDFTTWAILAAILLSGIILSGCYPAWFTLRLSPKTLFGSMRQIPHSDAMGKVLTTLQYSAAMVLVAWVVAINLQLHYVFTKDIGITKENVIVIDLPVRRDSQFESSLSYFINQAERIPSVMGTSVSSAVAGDFNMPGVSVKQKVNSADLGTDSNGGVDEKFIPFYGIKLLAGRNFIADEPSDRKAIILSKTSVLRMGLTKPEDAVGLDLVQPAAHVIGVIEDYALSPLLVQYATDIHGARGIALLYGNTLAPHLTKNKVSVKLKPGLVDASMSALSREFAIAFPDAVFQWYALDSHINQYYNGERIFLQQIFLFTGIAIGIACLGLLGMISNKAVEKTREIGIRKVLGARLHQVAQILLEATGKQLLVASTIALPLAYYLTQQYLEKYTTRITSSWWHFALPVVLLLAIMLTTISTVLIRTARTNPVDSLRHQ